MSWRNLDRFTDEAVPKLNNLRRAAQARLRVPATWWLPAATSLAEGAAPPDLARTPLIIRSGSPTEDTHESSNAGQLLSLVVSEPSAFAGSLQRVVEALPRDDSGRPRGAVFVQPLIRGVEAGVAFFDGFYYERALAAGGNEDVTSGQARGQVTRGYLVRGEAWSEWLASVYRVFGRRDGRIDVEFARDDEGYVLLQSRPALFPVRRNFLLTLANIKETMGEFPCPFSASASVEGVARQRLLQAIEPETARWAEPLFLELGGRAWANVSFWFRWLDHIGAPRSLGAVSVGGVPVTAADRVPQVGRILARLPRLALGHLLGLVTIVRATRALRGVDDLIDSATDLTGLHIALAEGWRAGFEVAISIAGVRAGAARVRGLLGLPGPARLVTHDMMEEYRRLSALPAADREAGLDAWLSRHGHRGPLESDVARPRFAELRGVLLADLAAAAASPEPESGPSTFQRVLQWLSWPLAWPDERREWFRDQLMRRWARLRRRLLDEGERLTAAGRLDAAEDVFWLHGDDLRAGGDLREAVAGRRRQMEVWRQVRVPITATVDEVEALLAGGAAAGGANSDRVFPGIALSPAVFEGVAVKAEDLTGLLARSAAWPDLLNANTVLVVPTLEPSWAVVFPRVGGVVAEVGGEMSHASILLREARKPAIVNCHGVFGVVRDGDRLRLDGKRGVVELL